MIVLTCTHCRARLEMDDAFAGGVCRCMFCGTIQTVPSHLKRPGSVNKVKALYKQSPRPVGAGEANGNGNGEGAVDGSGELDQLAGVVANSGGLGGSGLSGSGLGSAGSGLKSATAVPRFRAETIAPPLTPWQRHRRTLLAAAGGGCAILLVVVWMLMFSDGSRPAPAAPMIATRVNPPHAPPALDTSRPNFCGVPLNDDVVVYVLDRGGATGEMFGYLKEACYRSIESLDDDDQFQIIFWNNGSDEQAFPAAGPTLATPDNLDAARTALDDVYAHGQSDCSAALAKAFAAKPNAIVLVTGKAYELDESFVQSVQRLRGAANAAKVHTIALGAPTSENALRQVAKLTGGEFRQISAARLREHAQ